MFYPLKKANSDHFILVLWEFDKIGSHFLYEMTKAASRTCFLLLPGMGKPALYPERC